MKTYRFDDKLSIPSTRKIQDTGQMIADGAIARVGVLKYRASDLAGLFADRDPDSVVRVAQLSDDLFAPETIEKFRSAPITIGHPEEDVNTKNMKDLGKGTLEGCPYQDGTHLSASLVLSDQEAIDLVNSGVHELSVRAYYGLTRVDDAEDYDAIRTIRTVNHVAIVERGRAGITCRISDSEEGSVEEEFVADVLELVEEAEELESNDQPEEIHTEEVVEEVAEVTNEETPLEVSVSDSELDLEIPEPTQAVDLEKALSDALGRIEALEALLAEPLDDSEDEVVEVTPMSKVIKQASLSDAHIKPYVSPAELARLRMIERNKLK